VRLWPLAALIVYLQPVGTFPYHSFQGLAIPLGILPTAGAALGYATLWTALITIPMMTAVQYVAAKVGLSTGEGIAANLRKHYPHWVGYAVAGALVAANTINAGADNGRNVDLPS